MGPSQSKATDELLPAPARLPGVPLIRIFFQGDRDASQAGSIKMRDFLSRAGRQAISPVHPEKYLAPK